ncbi:MAG: alpha/beta fold hydrolase [Candidatus Binatia bacterium]
MTTFVLVHGAWHGGWCWRRVRKLLREAGHEVFTPTLTGLGERAHLAGPEVGLRTHVQDVVAVFEAEDLTDVVLVGHSYGGMVVTGVAGEAAERLRSIVYLDAFVPESGKALADYIPDATLADIRAAAAEHGGGWRVPPFPVEVFGVDDPDDARWVGSRLTPHPLKTLTEALPPGNPAAARPPRAYVYCSVRPMGLFEQFRDFARREGWPGHVLATGHDAMVTDPRGVAAILLAH